MHTRLEQYLEEVSRPMPVSERVEWRTEAEQHLVALVAAYEELGHSHETATELALEKFGDANRLGSQMRTEAEKSTFPLALKVVTGLFVLQGLMCWTLSIPRFLFNGGINQALLVWGVPAFFIAFGLARRREFWRKAAVGSILLTLLISVPFTFIVANWVREVPPIQGFWRLCTYCAVPLWQLWVLTRPNTKALFEQSEQPRRPWARR